MLEVHNKDKIIEDIRDSLVTIKSPQGSVDMYIDTPVMYPDNSSVVVHVREVEGKFRVSDAATASFEAGMQSDSNATFDKIAERIAKEIGASYDKREIYFADVPRDQLLGSIVHIANGSQKALAQLMEGVKEKVLASKQQQLHDYPSQLHALLVRKLPEKLVTVAKHAQFIGKSGYPWKPSIVITKSSNGSMQAVCQTVHNHMRSVDSAVSMFYDIKQLEPAKQISRFAVTYGQQALPREKRALLTGLCDVVEEDQVPEKIKERLQIA